MANNTSQRSSRKRTNIGLPVYFLLSLVLKCLLRRIFFCQQNCKFFSLFNARQWRVAPSEPRVSYYHLFISLWLYLVSFDNFVNSYLSPNISKCLLNEAYFKAGFRSSVLRVSKMAASVRLIFYYLQKYMKRVDTFKVFVRFKTCFNPFIDICVMLVSYYYDYIR